MAIDKQLFRQLLQDRDYRIAASAGLIPGVSPITKFGYSPTAPVGITDIWPNGTAYPFLPATGQTIEAVSSSISDTVDLVIQGLDVAGNSQVETITLNGTTPVAIPGTWRAINRAFNTNGTEFLGIITIQGDGVIDSNVFATIPIEDQQTVQLPFIVPADKFALITAVGVSVNKVLGVDASAIYRLEVARDGGVFRTQIRFGAQSTGSSAIPFDFPYPLPVPPLSRIRITVDPTVEIDASGYYSILMIDKDLIEPEYLQLIEDS